MLFPLLLFVADLVTSFLNFSHNFCATLAIFMLVFFTLPTYDHCWSLDGIPICGLFRAKLAQCCRHCVFFICFSNISTVAFCRLNHSP